MGTGSGAWLMAGLSPASHVDTPAFTTPEYEVVPPSVQVGCGVVLHVVPGGQWPHWFGTPLPPQASIPVQVTGHIDVPLHPSLLKPHPEVHAVGTQLDPPSAAMPLLPPHTFGPAPPQNWGDAQVGLPRAQLRTLPQPSPVCPQL